MRLRLYWTSTMMVAGCFFAAAPGFSQDGTMQLNAGAVQVAEDGGRTVSQASTVDEVGENIDSVATHSKAYAASDALVNESISLDADGREEKAYAEYVEGLQAWEVGYTSKAIRLLTESAKKQYAPAQLALGRVYAEEDGTIKNPKKGFFWYSKAAAQGDAVGQYKAGMMALRGQGTAKDRKAAALLLRQSAEQGYAPAQTNYGSLYLAGYGVEADFIEAVKWFRKAAEQGYGDAAFLMGVAYEHGEGVEQNLEEAKAWYRKAVSAGNGEANARLYRLEGYKR